MQFAEFKGVTVFDSREVFAHSELEFLAKGKVRDLWRVRSSDLLVLFSTDRISAFDSVIPTPIPGKGIVLNLLSGQWFNHFEREHENHCILLSESQISVSLAKHLGLFADRIMLVKRHKVIPVECIVRGFITGSGWKSYKRDGTVCGITLPEGLVESQKLPRAIFTPTTKAPPGERDTDLDNQEVVSHLADWLEGNQALKELFRPEHLAALLKEKSLRIFNAAQALANAHGIILADTKFEFGMKPDGTIVVIDELLTPDSSRFWPKDLYEPGRSQSSFDKQFVRDYLDDAGWDHNPPTPDLPPEIVRQTQEKYYQAPLMLFAQEVW